MLINGQINEQAETCVFCTKSGICKALTERICDRKECSFWKDKHEYYLNHKKYAVGVKR